MKQRNKLTAHTQFNNKATKIKLANVAISNALQLEAAQRRGSHVVL